MQVTMWFGAFAVSALLLGGRRNTAVTEAAEPPALLLVREAMPESVRRLDARVTERALARTCITETDRMAVTSYDLEVLARIVNGECPHDTPFEGKVAVAAVVLNRVRSKRFPMSIPEVAHQEKQFSCYNPSSRARLYGAPIPPVAWEAARAAVEGQDPTGGCTHFFNPHIVQPGWARDLEFVKRIGTAPGNTHAFYRRKGSDPR
ncbi:MAG TPA: cell wall hydrolase [Planctomycetota bacterium]|nr:cell wall hydrolase [Planctomycetota bacterium]